MNSYESGVSNSAAVYVLRVLKQQAAVAKAMLQSFNRLGVCSGAIMRYFSETAQKDKEPLSQAYTGEAALMPDTTWPRVTDVTVEQFLDCSLVNFDQ